MGCMMKSRQDVLTLQIRGDGPLGGITVTADAMARVKGYVHEPSVLLHANQQGKLDVAGAVGHGYLRVIKDMGLKEPYVGEVDLQTGEIAEDLTYYFATSEQVPSSVGLGVLMSRDNTVKQAGGFILQLMPFAEERIVDELESNLRQVRSVTSLLEMGYSPEKILEKLLGELGVETTDRIPTSFCCNCTKDRVSKALISVGKKDLQEMIDDGKEIEVNCQFCGKHYQFTVEELKDLKNQAM